MDPSSDLTRRNPAAGLLARWRRVARMGTTTVWVLLLGGLLLHLGSGSVAAYRRNVALAGDLTRLRQEVKDLSARTLVLRRRREELRTDPVTVERILRDRYRRSGKEEIRLTSPPQGDEHGRRSRSE